MKMKITITSGISADGFNVEVVNSESVVTFKNKYSYGYDASYSRHRSNELKPYTTDIVKGLMLKYGVKFEDIEVLPGIYVFNGEKMTQKEVVEFTEKYLTEINEVAEKHYDFRPAYTDLDNVIIEKIREIKDGYEVAGDQLVTYTLQALVDRYGATKAMQMFEQALDNYNK